MIPPDHDWMNAALGAAGFGTMRHETDRTVEERLLRSVSDVPQDAFELMQWLGRDGTKPLRCDLALQRLRYLELIEFRRGGWVLAAAGKAVLAGNGGPADEAAKPAGPRGPTGATKQLDLF